jgi:serine/threonine protein kinase
MSTVAWPEVREIVAEALDAPEADRPALLDRRCGVRARLRAEVEALLAATDAHEETLVPEDPESLATRVAALLTSDAEVGMGAGTNDRDGVGRGTTIGPYRVLRHLGSGGIGIVYEAIDTRLDRPVALKLMWAQVGGVWIASESMRARFQAESRTLARLRHPAIAQVYEAGVHAPEGSASATPYFAMELVPGARTLDRYLADAKPSREVLLRLFADVAEAVHHGHQKSVVHRDLKPANILIDEEGRPKLIDFGVASLQDAHRADAAGVSMVPSIAKTMAGQIIGTLSYMSPEASSGEPDAIDVRTDVYSLGAVLYEALAGRAPIEFGTASTLKAIELIRTQTPPRLSSLDPTLGGTGGRGDDLETIVMKALAKDPADRYASANGLAMDLRRYLSYQPILARPPSTARAIKLFIRRHRWPLVAASVTAGALVAGSVGLAVGLVRARTAEAAAMLDADRSKRVADFLEGVLRATSVPQVTSEFWREPAIAPIAALIARHNPAGSRPASAGQVAMRVRHDLDSKAIGDPALAARLRLLTLQVMMAESMDDPEMTAVLATTDQQWAEAAAVLGMTDEHVLAVAMNVSPWTGVRDALGFFDRAYAMASAQLGAGDPRTLEIGRKRLSLMCDTAGQPGRPPVADVLTFAQQLVDDATRTHGSHARATIACQLFLSRALGTLDDRPAAAALAKEVLSHLEPSEDDPLYALLAEQTIGDAMLTPVDRVTLVRVADVQRLAYRAARRASEGAPFVAFDSATWLAQTLVRLGEFKEAEAVMREVAEAAGARWGDHHHVTSKSQSPRRTADLVVWR